MQSTPANKSAAAAPKTGIIATFGSIRQKDETPPPHPARSLLHRRRFGTTQSPIRPAARRRAGENRAGGIRFDGKHPHGRRRRLLRKPRRATHPVLSPGHSRRSPPGRLLQLPRGNARRRAHRHGVAAQTPQKGPPRGFPDRHPLQRYLPSPVLQRRNDSRLRMHDNGVARSRTGPLSDGSRNGLVHPGGSHRRKNLRNNRSQDTQNPGRGVPGFPAPIQRGRNTLLVCTCGKRQNEPAGRILPGRRRRADREVPVRHTSAGSSSSRSANPKLRDMFPDTSDCRPRPCRAKRTG